MEQTAQQMLKILVAVLVVLAQFLVVLGETLAEIVTQYLIVEQEQEVVVLLEF
jgi:hypothetical protein